MLRKILPSLLTDTFFCTGDVLVETSAIFVYDADFQKVHQGEDCFHRSDGADLAPRDSCADEVATRKSEDPNPDSSG